MPTPERAADPFPNRSRRIAVVLTMLSLGGIPTIGSGQAVPIGGDFEVSQSTTLCVVRTDVAAAPDGRFVVTWTTTGADRVMRRRFDSSGAPLESEQLFSSFPAGDPSVGMAASGDFVIAWESETAGLIQPLVQRFDSSGSPVGPPFSPGSPGAENTATRVAVADEGSFVLSWRSATMSGNGIGARRFASDGTTLGLEIEVSPTTSGVSANPELAVDPAGEHFIVTWESAGAGKDVSARRFSSDGSPLSSTFTVNTYTTGDQSEPRVSTAADGSFAVTWTGAADGNAFAARLARFDSSGAPIGESGLGLQIADRLSSSPLLSNDGGSIFAVWTDRVWVNEVPFLELHALANELGDLTVPNAERDRFGPRIAMDDRERAVVVWLEDLDRDSCNTVRGARYQVYRTIGDLPVQARVTSLQPGAAWKHYVVFPEGPSRLHVTLDGLSGDADLYTRFGDFASSTDYSCRPYKGGSLSERCTADTDGPPLLIGVNGFQTNGVDFTLTVTETPFLFRDGFETGDTSAWSTSPP